MLIAPSAMAADFPVSDRDQANIAFICDVAKTNPLLTDRDKIIAITEYCVQWKARQKAAQEEKK